MTETPEPPAWLVRHPGLTALAVLVGWVALLILLPYLQFVLFSVVLAYVLFPLQRRAEQYVRPTVASALVVVAALFLILLPLIYLLTVAVRQSLRIVSAIREGQINVARSSVDWRNQEH